MKKEIPDTRANTVQQWRRAQAATNEVKRHRDVVNNPISTERLRVLVDQGAIVPLAGLNIYIETFKQDDLERYKILLEGSEYLSKLAKLLLISEAANAGAVECVGHMIKAEYPLSYNELGLAPSKYGGIWSDGSAALGEAIEGVTATDDADPLSKAVRGDHLECAEMLILAGANLNGYKDSSPRPMTYFSRTKSAAMFDLLSKHGLQPVKDDLWVRSDTDPELVKRFMDTGIPAQGKHIRDGSVWLELLRSPREVGLKEENVLKIGHILMDAGYPPSGTTLFPFFSLRIFMKLNLDPKLMPHLVEKSILYGNHWNSFSPLPGSEAIEPGNSREQNMFLLKTLDEYGMDTGLFWDKDADISIRRAMLEIGIVPENGEGGSGITNKEIAQAQAVRLQNKSIHTSKTAHRPRRI